MKGSGVEWIGKIPSSWIVGRLKDVVAQEKNAIVDGPFGSAINTKDYVDEGVPLVRITNLNNGYVNKNDIVYITEEHAEKIKRSKIRINDIIVAKTGATVGKCAINKDIDYGILSSSCIKATISNDHIPEFYLYLMSTNQFRDELINACNGTTRDTINLKPFSTLIVPIPNSKLKEELIASYLNTTVTQLDLIIEKTKSTIEDYKLLKQSIITEAVTKGLDKNVGMKDSGIEWVGMVPKHWNVGRMKNYGKAIIGLTYSPDDVKDSGKLVLRSSNIQEGQIDLTDCVYVDKEPKENLLLKKNDILICARNGSKALVGKSALVPEELMGETFGAFMTVYRSSYNEFIYFVLNSSIFDFYIGAFSSSTINQLTTSTLNSIQLALPPVAEQNQIVSFLKKRVSKIDKLILDKNQLLKDLESYKKSLIYEYVTGKKEVE